jgi:hypothetical protein
MNEELNDKHAREWEAFETRSNKALDDLIEEEISVYKQYGMLSDHLPKEWRDTLERKRRTFIGEWSGRGTEVVRLNTRQREEIKDQEDGSMLMNMFMQHQADEELKKEIAHAIEEKDTVTSYYDLKDKPVPHATQQRFAKRFLELGDRYNRREYQKRRTLDEDDLINETESRNDLIKQHEIIRMHYQRAKYIPQTSIAQMKKEVQEFDGEIEAHQLTHVRNEFKEQLREMHQHHQQSAQKPRPS